MAITRLEAARAEAAAAVDNLTPDRRSALDSTLALSASEHFQYQETQARAFASGRIPQDVATFLYASLGETGSAGNGGWAAGTSTADKVIVTQAIAQLIQADIALARIGGRR